MVNGWDKFIAGTCWFLKSSCRPVELDKSRVRTATTRGIMQFESLNADFFLQNKVGYARGRLIKCLDMH